MFACWGVVAYNYPAQLVGVVNEGDMQWGMSVQQGECENTMATAQPMKANYPIGPGDSSANESYIP